MTAKEMLLRIFESAIRAVQPDIALLRHLSMRDGQLYLNGNKIATGNGKIRVVGAGKGAAPMARALEELLGAKIAKGLAVVKYGHALALKHIEIVEAAHPVPDAAGEAAARRMLEIAGECGKEDLLICILTGGASALLPAPAAGIRLDDIRRTTALLLQCGAPIQEINAVRKHLSRLAGGQLAQAANGARVLSLIVSDVVGDNLDVIASGPTAPDESTFAQCMAIVDKYGLAEKLPAKVFQHLQAGVEGREKETPNAGAAFFTNVDNLIIASNDQALKAAAATADKLGCAVRMWGKPMQGEAREMALEMVAEAKRLAQEIQSEDKAICLLAGGETTVTIRGAGKGGRNQEMALAANLELMNAPRICGLFAGTDGTDGPTDAAGGFIFTNAASKLNGTGRQYLENNDSYEALRKMGNLLVTGPTLTNVMDIAILLIAPPIEVFQ